MSFESANSLRDVRLDTTAEQKRSVRIQRKMERNCRKRDVHIKIIQSEMEQKPQIKRLYKTGILSVLIYGHAATEV